MAKILNRGNISIDDLHYDIDNDPRFTRCDNQEDAYQELLKLGVPILLSKHMVRDGAQHNPILARLNNKKAVIIDGHNRLAALRYLHETNKNGNWSKAKVEIFDIDEGSVKKLRGEIQIQRDGSQPWPISSKLKHVGRLLLWLEFKKAFLLIRKLFL
tara:strand:+ start:41 stop:511 length:471 start_codon:yes stop_codon:yes gene_type:complete